MRLLHTSDWHLGVSLHGVSREAEQRAFVEWLVAQLEERQVDALLLAGDIFDSLAPSTDALRLYYEALRRISDTSVRKVVVIGGNHDSPSRLDAPREVLRALDVHVVGGLSREPESWDACLCPLPDQSGEVAAVAVAVPFVHEYRLGIRTTAAEPVEVAARFAERFRALYSDLADRARERFGDVPLVGLGHLTAAGTDRDDYPQEIHQVGSLGGLPPSIFDERYDYVALGHIHQCRKVAERVWYSGSPVPYSRTEGGTPRCVLQVDLGEETTVQRVEVPLSRALVPLDDTPKKVARKLAALTWDEPLPPLVYVTLFLDGPDPGAQRRVLEALDKHPEHGRPRVVNIRESSTRTDEAKVRAEAGQALPALSELTPRDVFRELCKVRNVQVDDALAEAFGHLLTQRDEDEA